jgi:hypothetical protein
MGKTCKTTNMSRSGASSEQSPSPNYADAKFRRNMTIAQIDIAIAAATTDFRDRDLLLYELSRRLRTVRSEMMLRAGRMSEVRGLLESMQASQDEHGKHEALLTRSLSRWAPELVDEASIDPSHR